MSSVDAPPGAEAPAPEPEPEGGDELRQGILARVRDALGDAVVADHLKPGDDLWVRVQSDAWRTVGEVAKEKLNCRFFDFLSAIDWLPSPFGRYEDAEVDTPLADRLAAAAGATPVPGYTGGDTRFQLIARVVNIDEHWAFTLKADVPDDTMTVDSWTPVYAGADWHERETWEMFGISFAGHNDLRHIYLPTDFEGHPLRKDYPLLARVVKPWPGIVDVEPMPGQSDAEPAEGDDVAAEGVEGGDP